MTDGPASTYRLDRLIWWSIAAVAALVVAMAAAAQFTILWNSLLIPGTACVVLCSGAAFYARIRRDHRLGSTLQCTAQICAFFSVGAPLSYLAASAGFPLQDSWLAHVDRALDLDWRALLVWMNDHPGFHPLFTSAYMSFAPQATTTVLALGFCGHLKRLRMFVLALMLAALATIAISAVLPAQGVWGHDRLSAADYPDIVPVTRELHLPTFFGLRDGSFRLLMAQDSQGIVTFPSLHAALAVIFMVALWPVPVLRWLGIALNVTMILATPIEGGHYFIDVIAGVFLAILCWMSVRALSERDAVATVSRERGVPEPELAD